jgi:threonine synthase
MPPAKQSPLTVSIPTRSRKAGRAIRAIGVASLPDGRKPSEVGRAFLPDRKSASNSAQASRAAGAANQPVTDSQECLSYCAAAAPAPQGRAQSRPRRGCAAGESPGSFLYRCSQCSRRYTRDEVRYLCPSCGAAYRPGMPLCGVLTAEFDYDSIRRTFRKDAPDWTLFSAVAARHFPPYPVGNTPFFPARKLGAACGFKDLWIKHDGLNPSGSLKDRASFLVVAEAHRVGEDTVVTASTGNAASALAAVCAAAGRRAVIFVPATAPRAKLAQIVLSGARVVPVRGTYDDAFRLSLEYTARAGGLNRNTAYHPLTIEGKKTVGLEILEQNGWQPPDAILIPVGDGVILSGVHKAFCDLKAAGLIARLPRLICVQARTSDAIHRYIRTGTCRPAARPATVADSISVSVPSNAHLARAAVKESGGLSVTVSDAEILRAQRTLASTSGVFAEPAAAATAAALPKLRDARELAPRDRIVLLITGHGLKDIDAALRGVRIPPPVEPRLDAAMEFLRRDRTRRRGRT